MTEIERLLTDTLAALEQELRQAQEDQARTLSGQEKLLRSHTEALHQIQQQVSNLRTQQRESTQQLQNLSDLSMKLEQLLKHLNVILEKNRYYKYINQQEIIIAR